MQARRDAAVGAAAFVIGVRELVVRDFPGAVATVGDIRIEPGSFNVVPGRATLRLECRSLDPDELDALEGSLGALARTTAEAHDLGATVVSVGRDEPARTSEDARNALTRAASDLGLTTMELPSGAGHDARSLAAITPSGMVFVPSQGGISHDPAEETAWADCRNGANVLLNAALRLAAADATKSG
jgi:N-carbamoyl-L-amino-acid hydrolase